MSRRFAIALAAALALIPCSVASAATRYVSPTGSSSAACTQLAPCSLGHAQSVAASGDTILVGAGTYGTPGMAPAADVTDGTKVLTFAGASSPAPVIWNRRLFLFKPGSKASNLDVRAGSGFNVNNLVILEDGTSADRIAARHAGTGSATIPCQLDGNTTLANSVCEGRRTDSAEVEALRMGGTTVINPTYNVRNVTAVADSSNGNGFAAYVSGSDATVNLTNVIATGPDHSGELELSGGKTMTANFNQLDVPDLVLTSFGTGGGTLITHGETSLFGAAPQFVDEAGGDFRELASSPSVDAGADDPANGALDLAGVPRTLGAHTDIGAYELVTFDNLCAATKATGAFTAPMLCSLLAGANAVPSMRRFYLTNYINLLSGRTSGMSADDAASLIAAAKELL